MYLLECLIGVSMWSRVCRRLNRGSEREGKKNATFGREAHELVNSLGSPETNGDYATASCCLANAKFKQFRAIATRYDKPQTVPEREAIPLVKVTPAPSFRPRRDWHTC
jgi:hypothetical protein